MDVLAQQREYSRARAVTTLMALSVLLFGLAPAAAFETRAEYFRTDESLLTDANVTQEVEARLVAQEVIRADSVDVETNDRIVSLSGSVKTILAKQLATDIARSVRGVKAVVNHITVEPSGRDDETIREDIADALREDPATEAFEVTVWVEDGAVALTGWVDSSQERELAGLVAKGVRGVRAIDNRMAVRRGEERFDSEIQAEIEQTLRWSARVDDSLMAVTVRDGTAFLAGSVESLMEKAEAMDAARSVRGVREVEAGELEVADLGPSAWRKQRETFQKVTNAEIGEIVERAFSRDPRLTPHNLSVVVRDGIATLRGVVTNHEAKRAAEETAHNVVGVWRVRNLVKVRPRETLSDHQIAANVRRWLERDPIVDTDSITTKVSDGMVHLTGSVESDFEEARAISAASRTRGVIGIRNELEVWDSRSIAAADKEDWEIHQDIVSRLYWSPFVDGDAVTVDVEDGVATLTGMLDTWPQRQAATDSARAAGAERVHNEIRVRFGPPGYLSGGESEESS